jgi:hypothetical protein
MIYPSSAPFQTGKFKHPQHNLTFDSMADFPELQAEYTLDNSAPGSIAFCADTSDAYILRGDTGNWTII